MRDTADLSPSRVVQWLDRHVVGQDTAKRIVAIALRNRQRRRRVEGPVKGEILPTNIILMGPTGTGKTEIARRLATLVGAPFVKVEATKYSETGYVGRDVEGMIRDLVRQAVNQCSLEEHRAFADEAREKACRLVATALKTADPELPDIQAVTAVVASGDYDDLEVEIQVRDDRSRFDVLMPGAGIDQEGAEAFREMIQKLTGWKKRRSRMRVRTAIERLVEEEIDRRLDQGDHVDRALEMAQEEGIVFIDEIDKVVGAEGGAGPDVSRSGVQRDLLPLVEGTVVQTRWGPVRTDHILFIASGAFHGSSPSDLIPELQGRFPLHAELDPLSEDDLFRILTQPEHCLLAQYKALLAADGVILEMDEGACREVARIAMEMNSREEDIGARRLRTVLTHLLDEYLFGAPDLVTGSRTVTAADARVRLSDLAGGPDEEHYIL